jgi:hypothetical protein
LQVVVETISGKLAAEHVVNQKLELQVNVWIVRVLIYLIYLFC